MYMDSAPPNHLKSENFPNTAKVIHELLESMVFYNNIPENSQYCVQYLSSFFLYLRMCLEKCNFCEQFGTSKSVGNGFYSHYCVLIKHLRVHTIYHCYE